MTAFTAYAKINLLLRVGPRADDGLHQIVSLAQWVDLVDEVTVAAAGTDGFVVDTSEDLGPDEDNLAWVAAAAVRSRLGSTSGLDVSLAKQIPVAAGLGGGSADAAASLVATADLLGGGREDVEEIAPTLGADVPACVIGGTLWMEGGGERLTGAPGLADHHLAMVTPVEQLDTGAVYRAWDDLGGPSGPPVPASSLPPSLRQHGPLINDLTPAALSLAPSLGDWMADVERVWGQRPLMSGSGPTVFGFFASRDEADAAAAAVGGAVRLARGVSPVDRGWDGSPGTLPPPPWGVV